MLFWRSKSDLEDRISNLESDIRRLKTEWADMYDKLLHIADRMSKRQKKLVPDFAPENDDLNTQTGIFAAAKRQGLI